MQLSSSDLSAELSSISWKYLEIPRILSGRPKVATQATTVQLYRDVILMFSNLFVSVVAH